MTRTVPRLLILLLTSALFALGCGSDDDGAVDEGTSAETEAESDDGAEADDETGRVSDFEPGVLASGATIGRFEAGDVTVHTYTNPEAGFGNTTAVIESENALVLIDSHFGPEPATEFRALADSVGKPIERLVITHEHPDHIGGIEAAFSDVDSYSSAGVVAAAAEAGATITNTLEAGEMEIDGVTYRFEVFTDAEAEEQVVISLPDHGVVATGDLVYNQYHAVMTPTFDNWIGILEELAADDDLTVVIPGHGPPGGPEAFADTIDYLTTAQEIFAQSDDADAFNAAMVEAYPDRPGANLLAFGSGRLFP